MTYTIASIIVLGKKQAIDARVFILERISPALRLSSKFSKKYNIVQDKSSPLMIWIVFWTFRSLVVATDSTSGNQMTSYLIHCSNKATAFFSPQGNGERGGMLLVPLSFLVLLHGPLFKWSLELPYSCPVLQLEAVSSRLACLPKSSQIYQSSLQLPSTKQKKRRTNFQDARNSLFSCHRGKHLPVRF